MEPEQVNTVKTTLNLDASVKQRIDALAKCHVIKNQTSFINSALQKSLEEIEKKENGKKLKVLIHSLKHHESSLTSLEARDQMRAESLEL